MKNIKWQYSGDINMLDYGGTNSRCIGNRVYQFITLTNMEDACGDDATFKYNVELKLVDLKVLSAENIQSALCCMGQENLTGDDLTDEILADSCDGYGLHAPLETFNGNNAYKLLRAAKREANNLLDSATLENRLDRAVNKLGSSAREFMAGDFTSAMVRGVESGDPMARITMKMHGVDQQTIDDARPADYLPFVFGYMAGIASGPKETDPDTVPEYFRGYERGQNVKAGKCPAPSWIQSSMTVA